MLHFRRPLAQAATAATLLGMLALAGPLAAQTTPPPPPPGAAPAAPPPGAAPAAPPAKKMAPPHSAAYVESRIKQLHRDLHITKDQEAAWASVAQVMRENAKSMEALAKERYENASKMTALDDLRSYSALADAHADGLKKFIPVFQQLYDSMSDAQKKRADALFRARIQHRVSKTAPKAQ